MSIAITAPGASGLGAVVTGLDFEAVPPSGGDTAFTNMLAACDALSDELKARIADLKAIHT